MIAPIIFLFLWGTGCACLDFFGIVKHPAWFYALGAAGMAIADIIERIF
jgi:hypothetical protein